MRIISAYSYAHRYQPPTTVSFSISWGPVESRWLRREHQQSGIFPRSEELEKKIKDKWGTVRYADPIALLAEKNYLGIMKAGNNNAEGMIEQVVEALITQRGGIDEITIAADNDGYRAVLKRNEATIHIKYDGASDSVFVMHYIQRQYPPGVVRSRVTQARAEEPRTDKEGYKERATTEDIGVLAYGINPVVATITANRKKLNKYNRPKVTSSIETTAEIIKTEFVYSFASNFPNAEERAKIEQGESIKFTVRFKGYRHSDKGNEARDTRLNNTYLAGIQNGVIAIFRNMERIYTGRSTNNCEERKVQLTEQEWFEKVFLKAKGNEEKNYRAVDKDDPFYKWACREAGKKADGKPVSLPRTVITPTAEGIQEAYDQAIAEKRAMPITSLL